MDEMTIGELARRARLRPSTLRYYESLGILSAQRRVSGQRRYTIEALKQLSIIGVAKQAGFTLAEIGTLLGGFSEDIAPSELWKAMAREKLPQVEDLIERAQGMKRLLQEGLACECMKLDDCVVLVHG